MAEEPDTAVLRLLRDVRAIPDDHSRVHGEHRRAFERLDRRMDHWRETMPAAIGLAVHGNPRPEDFEKRLDDLTHRIEVLERRP